MTIIIKNKETLIFDDFIFRCSVGKNGFTKNKIEGDFSTPRGLFDLGDLYYRKDRSKKPLTKLNIKIINQNMGWCDDSRNKKNYNKLIDIRKKIKSEKIFRKDSKYDFLIPIKYNVKNVKLGKGSAIFIHTTKNYRGTAGCIALSKKDFLILIKLINKKTKIQIY
jgi:L,D-peptidoglycan transpeptidase YkuD (ErfK/YbiS/YcfS/YnhG family)